MPFSQIKDKTTITGFSGADATIILDALKTAYNGSSIAKKMLDDWVNGGKTIDIKFVANAFQAYANTGKLELDLAYIKTLSYISDTGQAVLHSVVGAIVHELGHALTGRLDNHNVPGGEFMGDNVKFTNTIWNQLGIPKEISYVAQAWDIGNTPAPGYDLHRSGYEYTNGDAVNGAITSNGAVLSTGATNDLLIGGPSANKLTPGAGNDFMAGAGGNDEMNGGAGKDTAVYFGNPTDYDIRLSDDATYWTVRHVRGSKDEGTDTLENVEVIQFGAKRYDLEKEGLTFQTDFAFVIDTTGSMGDDIDAVKANANAIIDALFKDGAIDARIGVIGFKDTTIGEPTEVILPFTDQDSFADRKAAAIAAINGIGVGGGGDLPETAFDGLRKALDGTMGDWRPGAAVHRVALFTDAEAKDSALAGVVAALAADVGATISSSSVAKGVNGSVSTFTLDMAVGSSGTANGIALPGDGPALPPLTPHDDPALPLTTKATLEIYTIITGDPAFVDTTALEDIASTTGGEFLTAPDNDALVELLLEIINLPSVPPILGTPENDKLKGTVDDDVIIGLGGRDTMWGLAGSDTFVFQDAGDTGKSKKTRDKIKDFDKAFDKIDLSDIDTDEFLPDDQGFTFIGRAKFHGEAGELRVVKFNKPGTAKDYRLVEADIDGNAKADFVIELKGLGKLAEDNFIL